MSAGLSMCTCLVLTEISVDRRGTGGPLGLGCQYISDSYCLDVTDVDPFFQTTTSAVFAIMTVTCILGGPVANRLGLKWTVMIGVCVRSTLLHDHRS